MEHDAPEILSAFADGESVETPRLLDALTRPGAHEALVDFIQLRGALEETARDPRPEFVRRMRAKLNPAQRFHGRTSGARRPWWRQAILVPAPALAAVLALFLAAFLLLEAPDPTQPDRRSADAPPASDRVLYFEEGVDWNSSSARFLSDTPSPNEPV